MVRCFWRVRLGRQLQRSRPVRLSPKLAIEALECRELLSYSFTLIADTGLDSPYASFTWLPSINNAGTVAFHAVPRAGGEVIVSSGDDLTLVADTSDSLSTFFTSPTINDGGTVTFGARIAESNDSAYFTGDGGPLVLIADTTGSVSNLLNVPSITNGGTVTFAASLRTGGQAIMTGNGGALSTLYDTRGFFRNFFGGGVTTPINNQGTVAFLADETSGGRGIFRGNGSFPTPIADIGNAFTDLTRTPSLNDAGTVAFQATLRVGGMAILTSNGGEPTTIVDTFSPFRSFRGQTAINNAGVVLFYGDMANGGGGLYTGPDPEADKVIGIGDSLFDSTIIGSPTSPFIFTSKSLNDSGQIIFYAELADGRQVIARADPDGKNGRRASAKAVALTRTQSNIGMDLSALSAWRWGKVSPPSRLTKPAWHRLQVDLDGRLVEAAVDGFFEANTNDSRTTRH